MTERLYYKDPGLLEFNASIVDAGDADGRHWTVLDKSAFYPTSGGQLFDIGLLNGIPVVDVVETDEGEVRHLTVSPVGMTREKVTGVVDGPRRHMHRQQHTAQHIISQAFIEKFDLETVSVHLGEEYGAVELNTEQVTDSQLAVVLDRCREVIFDNHPVQILFITLEEARKLPLRKVPDRSGTIRVIKTGEFDYSACGGTHCDTTAQVGTLEFAGIEKMRGRVLVRFLAGEQLRQDYLRRRRVTDSLTGYFTCHVDDLPAKTRRLDEENKELRRETARLQKEMIPTLAADLASNVTTIEKKQFVFAALENYDPKLAGQLAAAIARKVRGIAAVTSLDRIAIAVEPDSGLHAGNIVKALTERTGARGGGNPTQAQAGGLDPTQLSVYRETLERIIRGL